MEFVLGIIHLVLVVYAIMSIMRSGATGMGKLLWGLFVFFFPIVGLVAWWLAGPKG